MKRVGVCFGKSLMSSDADSLMMVFDGKVVDGAYDGKEERYVFSFRCND